MTQKKDTPASGTPSTDAKPASPAPKKRILWPWWLLLLAIAILAGIAYTSNKPSSETTTTPYVPNANENIQAVPADESGITELHANQQHAKKVRLALRADVDANSRRLEELARQVQALADTIANQQPSAGTPAAAAEDTATLEQVEALRQQIAELRQTYAQDSARYATRIRLSQQLDAIAARVRDGETYADALTRLRNDAGDSGLDEAMLDVLAAHAEEGAPTLSDLMEAFDETMQAALPASLITKPDQDITDTLRGRLSHIVSIRKLEVDAGDDSDEAQLTRAEAELQAGNVAMALTHLSQLSDAPRVLFDAWRSEAEAYLDVQDALASLKSALSQPRAE
jgi:hypothetical protein